MHPPPPPPLLFFFSSSFSFASLQRGVINVPGTFEASIKSLMLAGRGREGGGGGGGGGDVRGGRGDSIVLEGVMYSTVN